jgi:hypothetical protein
VMMICQMVPSMPATPQGIVNTDILSADERMILL